MKRTLLILLCIIVAVCAQLFFVGVNGLTIVSIPITIYLGIAVLERLQDEGAAKKER